jgi:predicted PurR-regulated permease PerM
MRELDSFGKELPGMTNRVQSFVQKVELQYNSSLLPQAMRDEIDACIVAQQNEINNFLAAVIQGLLQFLSHIVGIIISPVLAFYLLYDWYDIKQQLLLIISRKWRVEFIQVLQDIDRVLSGVILGQFLIAAMVGVLVSISLYVLEVKYALIIGILAGLLDIIPYFGAIIGAAPAIMVSLVQSPFLAIKVAILFFIIHQLEGTVIQPKILGNRVGLSPLAVIFFVFVGGELAGLPGMLIGVPNAAIIKVIVIHIVRAL